MDIKVGMHIYKKCIMGILKYKTRILVTHNTHYLTQANKVILMENGYIKEQGIHYFTYKKNIFSEI